MITRTPLIERMLGGLLLTLIALQTFRYQPMPDNSTDIGADDGYPYYARHLEEHGTVIPEYRRLPGYPWFLVLAKKITGEHYSKAGYLVQGALSLVTILAGWAWARRRFGASFGLVLLCLLAAPNYWVRMSVFAYPDYLSALLSAGFAALTFVWIESHTRRSALLGAGVLLVLLAAMILLKSGGTILVLIFASAVLGARYVYRDRYAAPFRQAAIRVTGLVGASLLLSHLIIAVCGDGSVVFYRNAIHARIVTYLPPAAETEADRVVEKAKHTIQMRDGMRVEEDNFTNELAVVQPAVEQVWRARFCGNPGRYLLTMLEEFRRKHYLVGQHFTPFLADVTPHYARIPKRDDSPVSRLYRATGFYLPAFGDGFHRTVGAIADALGRSLLLWGPSLVGLWLMWRQVPMVALALSATFLGYLVALAGGIFIDGRYLLAFAPAIYLLQAAALTRLATCLGGSARSVRPDRHQP